MTIATWARYESRPTWSPDGARIAFLSNLGGDGESLIFWVYQGVANRVYRVDRAGGKPRLLEAFAGDWSLERGGVYPTFSFAGAGRALPGGGPAATDPQLPG